MTAALVARPSAAPHLSRQRLLAEVRRHTEQLTRRAERAGLFAHATPDRLARAELQRCLRAGPGRDAACECLVLLACAVDGGAQISVDMLEQCRELAARTRDPALRALFFTCARRAVLGGLHDARAGGIRHA